MENNNDIDDLFKDLIEPYEMSHSDKVWNSLDSQLDKKSNERDKAVIFRLRMALGVLLFLFGSCSLYYFLNSPDKNNKSLVDSSNKITTTNNSIVLNPTKTEKKYSSQVASENTAKTNANSNIVLNSPQVEKKYFNKVSENVKVILPKTITNKQNENISDAVVNTKSTKGLSSAQSESFTNVVIKKSETVLIDSTNYVAVKSYSRNELNDVASKDSTSENTVKKIITTANISDSNLVSVDKLNIVPISNVNIPVSLLTKETIDSIQKKQFKNRLSVIAYFSPDLTMKYLKDNDAKDKENEGDYRGEESADFSYNTGLLIGYDITKNWSVKFGGAFTYMEQTIKPKTVFAKTGKDGLTHYQFNTTYGSSELPSDQNPKPVIGDSLNIKSNSIQSLQIITIPLIAKYQMTRNKFSYYAQLGVSVNYLAGERLIVEETPNKPETISKIEGLNEYYFGGMFGLGVSYNPIKRFSILVEPTIKGAITPINNNTPIITHPFSFGLGLGIGWHF